jgi:hypothetical protein
MGTQRFETMAEVGTIALGLAVMVGLAVRWPKPGKSLEGSWESRTTATDGIVTTRRLAFVGPNEGWWRATSSAGGGPLVGDSLAFSVEGPRDNRFCVRLPRSATSCMVVIAFGDSLVVDSTASNVTGSSGSTRFVFHPVR